MRDHLIVRRETKREQREAGSGGGGKCGGAGKKHKRGGKSRELQRGWGGKCAIKDEQKCGKTRHKRTNNQQSNVLYTGHHECKQDYALVPLGRREAGVVSGPQGT